MFDTVLVANRGEIAVRVMKTLRRLGVRSVAVYSDADQGARHVLDADSAVRLGPASAHESYLNIERVIEAALSTGAEAIHPGYGFLSENAVFAGACNDAGLTFIGPSVASVEMMGDKIRAKRTVAAAGVPVVPGRAERAMTDEDLISAAREIGYPVFVKPSSGGGGKGMRLVAASSQLKDAIMSARREAAASFGDDTLFLERFVARPRHIEVQVLADGFGTTLHLGERECSLQRRHQKVIEEAPSVLLDDETRARITESAVTTARAVDYLGVGTVEFIVSSDAPDEFFFMEMNTRLQVEHPVTELVTGLDLVEQQLRVASGERLAFSQDEVRFEGHAIEARLYAEDPSRGFLPTGGKVLFLSEPEGFGVRIDSSLLEGVEVSTSYDPMVAKVIVHGADRATALGRLDRALGECVVLGIGTNTSFLRALLAHPDVREGCLDTELIERDLDLLLRESGDQTSDDSLSFFALARLASFEPVGALVDRWDIPDGWRLGEHASTEWSLATHDGSRADVAISGTLHDAIVTISRTNYPVATMRVACQRRRVVCADVYEMLVVASGRENQVMVALDGLTTWTWANGLTSKTRILPRSDIQGEAGVGDGQVRTPMPGVVIEVSAKEGNRVEIGERLVVIEAMKMEHALAAPFSGSVSSVAVAVGDQVAVDQLLVTVVKRIDAKGNGGSQ